MGGSRPVTIFAHADRRYRYTHATTIQLGPMPHQVDTSRTGQNIRSIQPPFCMSDAVCSWLASSNPSLSLSVRWSIVTVSVLLGSMGCVPCDVWHVGISLRSRNPHNLEQDVKASAVRAALIFLVSVTLFCSFPR